MSFHSIFKTTPYILTLAVSVGVTTIHAEENTELKTSYQHDAVVVTATRTSRTVNDTVSSVKVITHEDIVNSQANSVSDLLQGMVGVHFAQNGGRGSNTSLFLRGTNSNHVIVLIDGVKVGAATSGSVAFQNLPMEQIERIEVVRGPRSSLYGSEALGGVIQIFTKKGGGNTSLSSHVTVGSHDTYETSVGIAGGVENVFYNLSVEGEKTQGIDSCRAESAAPPFGGCYTDQPDKDGYKNVAGSMTLGYKTDFGSEFSVFSLLTNSESNFDGNYQDNSESEQRVLGFKSILQMTQDLDLSFSYSQTEDNLESYIGGIYSSTFDTTRDNASLQSNIVLFDRDVFTLGTDYQKEDVSTSSYADNERETYGIFSQYLLSYYKHDIELSARYDYNNSVKDAFTGSVGYAYQLDNNLRFFMSYGTAFKAPSFNELYFPFYGDPDVNHEESDTFEIGLRSENQTTNWALTYFSTKIDELIAYNSATSSVINIDIATIQGVELEAVSKLSQNWLLGTDLNIISPRNKSEGYQGNLLARRPKVSGRITLDYVTDTWTAGATLMHVGMRYDDVPNNKKLDSYQTLDLKAQYQLSEDLLVQGRVENVFDSNYETAQFYNQLGRSFYLTLRYAMN